MELTRIIKVGIPGPAGVGIESATVTELNELVFNFSDNTILTAGTISDVNLESVTLSNQELIFTKSNGATFSSGDLYFPKYDAGILYPRPNYTVISTNGTISISIPEFDMTVYDNSNYLGPIIKYTVSTSILDIPVGRSYVVGDYNSGTPTVYVTKNVNDINESDVIPIYTLDNIDNDLHSIDWGNLSEGLPNKLHHRLVKTNRFAAENDFSITLDNDRHLEIGANTIFVGVVKHETMAVISSLSTAENKMFQHWVKLSDLTWTISYDSQYRTDVYNPTTGNLTPLNNNYFSVLWIYRDIDEYPHGAYVCHDDQYNSLSQALSALIRTDLPDEFLSHGVLVGKIIFKKDATQGTAYPVVIKNIVYSALVNHNDLAGINGDTDGHYHVSSTIYGIVSSLSDVGGELLYDGSTIGITDHALLINLNSSSYSHIDSTLSTLLSGYTVGQNFIYSNPTLYLLNDLGTTISEIEFSSTHNELVGLQGGDLNNRYHIDSTLSTLLSGYTVGQNFIYSNPTLYLLNDLGTTISEIEFSSTHNELVGLQGGDLNNRYHLTSTIYDVVSSLSDISGELLYVGSTIAEISDITLATIKATLVDDDSFSLIDSVGSVLKRTTWSNLKSLLKAYFDPIYAAIQSGFIKGQMDVVTAYVATNGGVVTIPYTDGNAVTIDASALGVGEAFTVTVTNWPTTGTNYGLIVIRLKTGANVPTISWTGNVTDDPSISASEYKTLILTSWNAGVSVEISEGPVYVSV